MGRLLAKEDEDYWAHQAAHLKWRSPWHTVFAGDFANARWFEGGRLNVTETCLDQHLATKADKTALIWTSEDGREERLSYRQLHKEVCDLAKGLRALGAKPGDRIAIYMPLNPNAIIAMLACARIGAVHTVVFAGFSATSLAERIDDCGCRFVITADGFVRKGAFLSLLSLVNEALTLTCKNSVQNVIIHSASKASPAVNDRNITWDDCVRDGAQQSEAPEIVDAEDPLFILYTSGTTGKPKGLIHRAGGYLTAVRSTCELVFGLGDDDIFWCTADIGWITGHSYVVYGPLALGATIFIYEGALFSPSADQLYKLIERYRVSVLYTAPTAIRLLMKHGDEAPLRYALDSLRLLGSVGEPINPEAWHWYAQKVGKGRCPVVDTWWQTETGAMMISPLPHKDQTRPGSAAFALPGIDAQVVDAEGQPLPRGESGYLVINKPWPSLACGIYGDRARYVESYFSRFEGRYFSGDGARQDADGYYWILGRVDDVVNISGHRLGTAEVESALITHPAVAESAVVAVPDALTGQAIAAFVTLKHNHSADTALRDALAQCVSQAIGSFARPKSIAFVPALPKTRSGKIMRRVLRQIATKSEVTGDLSTLEDLATFEHLARHLDEQPEAT